MVSHDVEEERTHQVMLSKELELQFTRSGTSHSNSFNFLVPLLSFTDDRELCPGRLWLPKYTDLRLSAHHIPLTGV